MRQRFLILLAGLLGLWIVLVSSGCVARKSTPSQGGVLRLGYSYSATEINPITTDTGISATLLDLVFDTLVRRGADGRFQPELAERWEVSEDGRRWTFHLRQDVLFHDGTPLTSEDVRSTYEIIRKTSRSGYGYAFKTVQSIETPDRYTIEINFQSPDNLLWDSLGVIGIAPKRLIEGDPGYRQMNQHPIGSGPFRFVRQDDQEIVLEANAAFFQGRPFLDQIIVKLLSSQAATLSHLIAGDIDMVFLLNPEDYGALSRIPSMRIYHNWYPILYFLAFNLKNELFVSPQTRQALNLAVDRQKILERVLKGKGQLASGTVSPGSWEYNATLSPYPYQPEEALRLLKEQGWQDRNGDFILEKGKKKFEFSALALAGDEASVQMLQFVQQQLREIGVKMNIQELPAQDYVQKSYRERDFEATLGTHVFRSPYDNNYTFWHSSHIEDGLNFTSYSNPQIDRLLDEARLRQEEVGRGEAFREFQKNLHENPPGIFLFWRDMPIAIHKKFQGVPENHMESLRDLINVWIPKNEQSLEEKNQK